MSTFDVGDMFWGKSLSYPWWPCVIVPNSKSEIQKYKNKMGQCYHVQLIGSDYDVCWITETFLIQYRGSDHFERYLKEQITGNLSIQEKLKFDMRMSSTIQLMWNQSCTEADILIGMCVADRLARLPQCPIKIPMVVKVMPKRGMSLPPVNDDCPESSPQTIDVNKRSKRSHPKPVYVDHESDIESMTQDFAVCNQNVKSEMSLSPQSIDGKNSLTTTDENPMKRKRSYCKISNNEAKVETRKNGTYVPGVTIKKARNSRVSLESVDIRETANKSRKSIPKTVIDNHIDTVIRDVIGKPFKAERKSRNIKVEKRKSRSKLNRLKRAESAAVSADENPTETILSSDNLKTEENQENYTNGNDSSMATVDEGAPIATDTIDGVEGILSPTKVDLGKSNKSPRLIKVASRRERKKSTTVASPAPNNRQDPIDDAVVKGDRSDGGYRGEVDDSLWSSVTVQECSTEMMKVIISKEAPVADLICCHCHVPLSPDEDSLLCKGHCQSKYHRTCAIDNNLLCNEDNSICELCYRKEDRCCACENTKYTKRQPLVKCQKRECGNHFHVRCVRHNIVNKDRLHESGPLICPAHGCSTCIKEDCDNPRNDIGKFIFCIRCPISYHDDWLCIPAGSLLVSPGRLICHRHLNKAVAKTASLPLSRCFVCYTSPATLRCCRCRAAYHPHCLKMATYTDLLKDFVCDPCKKEQAVFIGQLAWIESTEEHQWNPVEVVQSTATGSPLTVRNLRSELITECNRYDLVLPFEAGLSILADMIDVSDPVIDRACVMNILYWNWRSRLRSVHSDLAVPIIGLGDLVEHSVHRYVPSVALPTSDYTHIDENILSDLSKNYLLGSQCVDVNVLPLAQVPITIIDSAISGRGVAVSDNVAQDHMIGEVCGSVFDRTEILRLVLEAHRHSCSYVLRMQENIYIDCTHNGNHWRHLNHSCSPNARLLSYIDDGKLTLGVATSRPLSAGEEVTIDYRESGLMLKEGFLCRCRSQDCRASTVVGPVLPTPDVVPDDSVSTMETVEVVEEAPIERHVCYQCGSDNSDNLVTCDKGLCRRQYHRDCLGASEGPRGLWLCPLHFCAVCGGTASEFCGRCPWSSCARHSALLAAHRCVRRPEAPNGDTETVVVANDVPLEHLGLPAPSRIADMGELIVSPLLLEDD